jgi:hypothetical protein
VIGGSRAPPQEFFAGRGINGPCAQLFRCRSQSGAREAKAPASLAHPNSLETSFSCTVGCLCEHVWMRPMVIKNNLYLRSCINRVEIMRMTTQPADFRHCPTRDLLLIDWKRLIES